MTVNYKILGQELNRLVYQAPENTNTIISKLKIKNTSYPANININVGPSSSFLEKIDNFYPDLNGGVVALLQLPDERILIGGSFIAINGYTAERIAILKKDGTLDSSFSATLNNAAYGFAVQSDGKILVGGAFASVNGETRNSLVRLNSDGTTDTSFNLGTGYYVFAVTSQSDGKILIGGNFDNIHTIVNGNSVNPVTRNGIARLNSDGTLDTSFNPNANSTVNSIAIQPDGKILIAGNFTTVGGTTRNYIARLNSDGTLDTSFNPNANAYVGTIAIQPDGKILIGGSFTAVGGVTRDRIARLNSDGTLDTSFIINFDDYVGTIAVQPDGKILVGGNFLRVNGEIFRNLVRLNSNGTIDTSFNFSTGAYENIYSIVIQSDEKILVAGSFNTIGGIAQKHLARISLQSDNNSTYLVKNKEIDFEDEIEFNGGIALEEGQILLIDTPDGEDLIIQAYGIEETV